MQHLRNNWTVKSLPTFKINLHSNMLQKPSAKNTDAKRQTQTHPCLPTGLRQLHLMLSRFHCESEALPSWTRLFCVNTSVIYHSHKIHSSVRSHYVNGQLITQSNQIFILGSNSSCCWAANELTIRKSNLSFPPVIKINEVAENTLYI